MPALSGELARIFRFLWGFLDEQTLPVTSAVLAMLISLWAAFISRKSMRASERSAAAAELQVNHAARQAESAEQQAIAAMEQAATAGAEASTAYQTSQLSALEVARARIDAALPRIAVVIFRKNGFAEIAESRGDLPVPLTPSPNEDALLLEHWPHWSWDAFFVSHGFLHNFGSDPARVIAYDVQFYAGRHPFTDEEIAVPPRDVQGAYLLYPGDYAIFQVLASKQVDTWVEILSKRKREAEFCESLLWFYPADSDKPECGARIRTEGMPLRRVKPQDAYAVFDPRSYFSVAIEFVREYPDSPEEVSAELRDDKDELFRLAVRKQAREERRRWLRERAGSDASRAAFDGGDGDSRESGIHGPE
ncbi:hypothetical protein ACNTMW_20130 [Planosporangium sp. 12N6]|uniref:hypothetical protein n=1 Tax=Planosporangium spinosum TaxID=3402278 RepID=UPI003CEF98A0